MVRLHQLDEHKWRARGRAADGTSWCHTAPTEGALRRLVQEEENKKDLGLSPDRRRLKLNLNHWADIYFDSLTKSSKSILTDQNYRYKYDRYVRPGLGSYKIISITQERIEEWASELIDVTGLAYDTVMTTKGIVAGVIDTAHRGCMCLDRPNPTRGAKLPRPARKEVVVDTVDDDGEHVENEHYLIYPLTFREVDELANAVAAPKYAGLRDAGLYEQIAALLAEGMTQYEIAKRLGRTTSLVNYHAKKWREDLVPGVC